MSTAHSVRPATQADIPAILGFILELAEYEHLAHAVEITAADLERDLFGPRPYAEALIACDGARPVGYALFFHSYSTFRGRPGVFLEDLYVTLSDRGRGHGKALLSAVAKLAVDGGCARLEWSVLDWNEPSIRFYRQMGAKPLEDWTVHRVDGEALAALASLVPE